MSIAASTIAQSCATWTGVSGSLLVRRPVAAPPRRRLRRAPGWAMSDRKSTRLNSSHRQNSYALFCLHKKERRCLGERPDGVMTDGHGHPVAAHDARRTRERELDIDLPGPHRPDEHL